MSFRATIRVMGLDKLSSDTGVEIVGSFGLNFSSEQQMMPSTVDCSRYEANYQIDTSMGD